MDQIKIYTGNEQEAMGEFPIPQQTPIIFDSSGDGETNLRVEIRSMSHATNVSPNMITKTQGMAVLPNLPNSGAFSGTNQCPNTAGEMEDDTPAFRSQNKDELSEN